VIERFEFDSDQESSSEIASAAKSAHRNQHVKDVSLFLGSRIRAGWAFAMSARRGRRHPASPTLNVQRVRRCTAAQGYAVYFVEHTSLNVSTICSLYECL
jgi:hypothetical protein